MKSCDLFWQSVPRCFVTKVESSHPIDPMKLWNDGTFTEAGIYTEMKAINNAPAADFHISSKDFLKFSLRPPGSEWMLDANIHEDNLRLYCRVHEFYSA